MGGGVKGVIIESGSEDVDLLEALIFCGVMDLAESCRARLLVDGHGIAAEEGVDKGGLSCIEIASDEDLGRGVLDTEAETVDVGDSGCYAVCEEVFYGGLFELVDEGGGRGWAEGEV